MSLSGLDRDERLAHLLAELGEQARQGREADVEALAAAHPDLADELRQLWAMAMVADALTPRRTLRDSGAGAGRGVPAGAALPRSFGDYDLDEELGRGGMGVVYRARQRSLGRVVALKAILRGEHASEADQARFQAEIRAVARLDHPHIVPVYEAGEEEGQAYFTMRYVEGRTLARQLASGPLEPIQAARLLQAISRAIHYAHQQGILHRDLKPSNVLIDAAGEPYVTDFGLAKRVAAAGEAAPAGGLTSTGAIIGTPSYMAPEQVSGSRGVVGPASDVYSLGAILYECLTGRPPFQAASTFDTLLLVLDQDPVRPRLLNPGVDPDLELICLKCIQKEPDLRYASAADLAADLEAFLTGERLSVRSYQLGSLFNRVFRETPHAVVLENWGLLWMWHSLTVLLICVVTWGLFQWGVRGPEWYLLLWSASLVIWGGTFWQLRKRGGPVLFVERQVAHVWAAAVLATSSLFFIEMLLQPRVPVLTLSPVLALVAGMVFVIKAGTLSGEFYFWGALLFLTAIPMALFPAYGLLIFGAVVALSFFVPGLKYHRQRLRALRGAERKAS